LKDTITLIIAEAALETVPDKIAGHPSVKNRAKSLGVKSTETLLDRSYHHAAMKRLDNDWKRGRPDIVHFALMEALGTPLFMEGKLRVYVHTAADKIIAIADNLRIPKSYFRFEGLMVDLFKNKEIKSSEGDVLMELQDGSMASLIEGIGPDRVIGLSTVGIQRGAQDAVSHAKEVKDCAFVVGGFSKGHFSEGVAKTFNLTYSISELSLEAHVVIARILYECEKLLEPSVNHERDEKRGQVRA
jgi:rRNA small subunit pseudouridine methyltransferase Nep1